MEITTLQIVLVFIVACIAGMGSILDEFQFSPSANRVYPGGYRSLAI
ncbi:mannose-specific PTS system transporter subunit IIC [Escherichia coli]|uniref:Mannose-specific PTS system transporter subunit IIC n=1 Tax=Escherichia coli TaxID=562 RepID=A0A377D547_ECOLX|nr:mannose-specific PTS system transporter subunit IIC [Escherichia coli]